MNDLFDALLDMSKLDAGVLEPSITQFPVDRLLKRMETTFAEAAREKPVYRVTHVERGDGAAVVEAICQMVGDGFENPDCRVCTFSSRR
jgi:hypothetical protein